MSRKLKDENDKRLSLLKIAGFDTENFGLINTFFLYDHLTDYFGWLSKNLNELGFQKLAFYLSKVKVQQIKVKGFEQWQTLTINADTGRFEQDGFVHDKDPESAIDYVCDKYHLTKC